MTAQPFHLAFFRSMFDNKVDVQETYAWDDLVQLFSEHRRTDQKNDLGFIIGTFKPVGEARQAKKPGQDDPTVTLPGTVGRYAENIIAMDALCVDYDGGASIEDVRAQLAGITHLGYTSYNHLKDGKTQKFRVVIPFSTPCPIAEWDARSKGFLALFPGADPVTFSTARIFYAPSTPAREKRPTLTWSNAGEAFDWTEVEPEKAHAPSPRVVSVGPRVTNELPWIRTKKYGNTQANDLFDLMNEGYQHRLSCYRIDDAADSKAGCFVVKTADGLRYHDNNGDRRFIRVLRSVVEKPTEEPTAKLTFKSGKNVPSSAIDQLRAKNLVKYEEVRKHHTHRTLVFETEHDRPLLTELSERYLPDDVLWLAPERGVLAIRSPKGSGKTERLADLVAQNKRHQRSTLLIGHRVHLLRNLTERTKLDNYQDLEEGFLTAYSAVCLNSLASRSYGPSYDTVIIDESEQVLQTLIGDHLKGIRNEVFIAFHEHIKNARLVVVLDADLSPLTLEVLRLLRAEHPDERAVGVINTYPIGANRTTRHYMDRYHLLHDAIEAALDGEKVYYATNSINRATTVARIMETLGKEVLLVTSETGEKEHVRAFIEHPAAEAIKYDVLVTSPTLSTGVSIDAYKGKHHFTRVYGEFGLNPGTFLDADQALSRVRDETIPHNVWIQANTGDVSARSEAEFYEEYCAKHRLSLLAIDGVAPPLSAGQRTWAYLCAAVEARVAEWSIYKPQQFRKLRSDAGWTIESVVLNKTKKEEGHGVYVEHDQLTDGHAQNVVAARQIDGDEYETLLKRKQRNQAEHLSMERYRYELELKKIAEPFTLENVQKAIQQNLFSSLRWAREHVLHDDNQRRTNDRIERQSNPITFTDPKHRTKIHELLEKLTTPGKINYAHLQRQTLQGTVEVTEAMLESVAQAFAANERECRLFFKSRIKDPLNRENYAKVWNNTLGKLSLPLKVLRVQKNGVRVRRYFIDAEKTDLSLRIIGSGRKY